MSASPESRDAEWAAKLPEIPTSTGVFWPSIGIGLLCTLLGLYLIVTDSPQVKSPKRNDVTVLQPTKEPSKKDLVAAVATLRCGFVDSKDSTFALAMEEFAKSVEQKSNGELTVELYPGGLFDGRQYDERSLVEEIRSGKLSMGLSTTSPLTNFNHLLDVFDIPFLFADYKHVDRVLDGAVGAQLLTSLRDRDLYGLGYLEVGFRVFSSSIPMPNYASFAGKKLRVMQSVTFTRFIKAIGGDPVPSPVDKIYLMGKEGYIDGADRTYPTYWDFRLYEVHRFITETHHAYSAKMILINDKLFESLTAQQKTILRESAKEASRLQRKKQREADQAVKDLALKEGIKIFELSPEERKKFVDASTELYDEYRLNQSSEILDAILEQNHVTR